MDEFAKKAKVSPELMKLIRDTVEPHKFGEFESFSGEEFLDLVVPETYQSLKESGFKLTSIYDGVQVNIFNPETGEDYYGFAEGVDEAVANAMPVPGCICWDNVIDITMGVVLKDKCKEMFGDITHENLNKTLRSLLNLPVPLAMDKQME